MLLKLLEAFMCHIFDKLELLLKVKSDEITGVKQNFYKTLYFSCILIWRFWSVKISLHFNLAFFWVYFVVPSDFSDTILFPCEQNCALQSVLVGLFNACLKFSDGQSEFSRVFNFVILCNMQNLQKLDVCEKLAFYSACKLVKSTGDKM